MAQTEDDFDYEALPPEMEKAKSDVRKAVTAAGRREARYLVDTYYQIQGFRLRTLHQIRGAEGAGEPNAFLKHTRDQLKAIEAQIQSALGLFARQYTVGAWLQSICGIGPVISAGLLAHLDIRKAPTSGQFFKFAGLTPDSIWLPNQKRPWNAKLKTLVAFKAGSSFVKVQGRKGDYYGRVYAIRKEQEWRKNLAGEYAEQAVTVAKKMGETTDAIQWLTGKVDLDYARLVAEKGRQMASDEEIEAAEAEDADDSGIELPKKAPAKLVLGASHPMLPPAHIFARARRYAAKLFLSHLHYVMAKDFHGADYAVPTPYCFNTPGSPHTHFIAPPNWPLMHQGKPLTRRPLADLLADAPVAPPVEKPKRGRKPKSEPGADQLPEFPGGE